MSGMSFAGHTRRISGVVSTREYVEEKKYIYHVCIEKSETKEFHRVKANTILSDVYALGDMNVSAFSFQISARKYLQYHFITHHPKSEIHRIARPDFDNESEFFYYTTHGRF